jgi:hypothetical protein
MEFMYEAHHSVCRLVFSSLCLLLAPETKAQAVTGYTEIDYDEDADTLDAYSETDLDFDLSGDYDAFVSLTVLNENGSIVSSSSARDNNGNGFISLERLIYGTTPDTTYTARHIHHQVHGDVLERQEKVSAKHANSEFLLESRRFSRISGDYRGADHRF